MSNVVASGVRGAGRLGKIRDVLAIVGRIRAIDSPLVEAAGLRSAVELLLELAEVVGVDWRWTDRLRRIVENEAIFELVLAIVRYVSGLVDSGSDDEALHLVSVEGLRVLGGADGTAGERFEAEGFLDWLPLVVQIVSLIRAIQGGTDAA